jgi:hypothetical protein
MNFPEFLKVLLNLLPIFSVFIPPLNQVSQVLVKVNYVQYKYQTCQSKPNDRQDDDEYQDYIGECIINVSVDLRGEVEFQINFERCSLLLPRVVIAYMDIP